MSGRELYKIMIKNDLDFVIDKIIEKNNDLTIKELKIEELEKEIERLNNIINELEKYIHNELVLDFYNDDMPCELIINKMEKMIKELKENNK